jgi:hypothetical protein
MADIIPLARSSVASGLWRIKRAGPCLDGRVYVRHDSKTEAIGKNVMTSRQCATRSPVRQALPRGPHAQSPAAHHAHHRGAQLYSYALLLL